MSDAETTLHPSFEILSIPQLNAAPIEGAVYPPEPICRKKPQSLLIHLYGHNGSSREFNMMRPPYVEVRRQLRERGWWLVVPDLGGSHWMNDAAAQTLDRVIDFMVSQYHIARDRVHLLGTSMGGGSSLIYAWKRPGRIRSLCAIFPMTDFSRWCEESPAYRPNILTAHRVGVLQEASFLHRISPVAHLDLYRNLPLMLIHGDADEIVPVHHSRDFAAALAGRRFPVIYHEVQGVGHSDVAVEHLQSEIVTFLTTAPKR